MHKTFNPLTLYPLTIGHNKNIICINLFFVIHQTKISETIVDLLAIQFCLKFGKLFNLCIDGGQIDYVCHQVYIRQSAHIHDFRSGTGLVLVFVFNLEYFSFILLKQHCIETSQINFLFHTNCYDQ